MRVLNQLLKFYAHLYRVDCGLGATLHISQILTQLILTATLQGR